MRCDTDNDCYPKRSQGPYIEYVNRSSTSISDMLAYLNLPSTRDVLGIDPHIKNASFVSEDVQFRFWGSGDFIHLTQAYVVELLARGVKVALK